MLDLVVTMVSLCTAETIALSIVSGVQCTVRPATYIADCHACCCARAGSKMFHGHAQNDQEDVWGDPEMLRSSRELPIGL
jgi:hypothetical protein